MIKSAIKRLLSEKQLQKVFRLKQSLKDSGLFDKGFKVFPSINIRLGNELVVPNSVSSITIKGWRNLILLYDKAKDGEKLEFRRYIKSLIILDSSVLGLLQTNLIQELFSKYRDLYLDFLGTAHYSNGQLDKAFRVFKELISVNQSERTYLYLSRCSMYVEDNHKTLQLLLNGCEIYPKSNMLKLALANAYFRGGNTIKANTTLKGLSNEFIENVRAHSHNLKELENEVMDTLKNGTLVRHREKLGSHTYTEKSVQDYWETLFFHFTTKSRYQHGWGDLRYITESKIQHHLKKYPDIKSVLNFGVFCGLPDYNLAQENPTIKFFGIDREKSTKALNDSAFKSNNLLFYAIDMLDCIYEEKEEVRNILRAIISKNAELMIFHARTATLVYPEALKRFYKACAILGVKYIALYENFGLSRSHMKYFDFDDLPHDSIPYYSIMMIHNYKKFLEDANYEIIEREVWNYSDLLWEGTDLFGADQSIGIGDCHIALLARLRK